MELLSPLILMILSTFIVALFINVLLPSRNHLLSILAISLTPLFLLFFQVIGLLQINSPSLLKAIVGTGAIVFFVLLLSQGSVFRKLFVAGIAVSLMSIPELLVTIPLAYFMPQSIGYTMGAPGQINVGIILYLTYLPVQFILSAVCAVLLRKKKDIFSEKNFVVVALFPATLYIILTIYIGYSAFSLTASTAYTSIIIGGCSFLSSVAFCLVLISLTRKTALEQQAAFYHKQLDLQLEHYAQLAQYDRTLSQIRHDLRNEITTLQILLREGNHSTAQAFMTEITDTLEQLKMISCCESNMINALIYLKHQEMRQAKIPFSCEIDLQDYTLEEEQKLCKLLEFILADAMGNCPSKDDVAFIRLSCHYGRQQLALCCEAASNAACDAKPSEGLINAVHQFPGKLQLSCTDQSVRVVRVTAGESTPE